MRSLLIALTASFALVSTLFSAEQSDYAPHAEGHEWVMDGEITYPNGEKKSVTGRRKVEGSVEYNGKTYLKSSTSLEGGPERPPYVKPTRRHSTGLYSVEENVQDAKEEPEILFPLKEGLTWKRSFGAQMMTHTVLGVETVTIADKKFEECFHIRSLTDKGDVTEDYWIAPNIGSVKSMITYANGVKLTLTLREFKPGKAAGEKKEPATSGK